MRSRVLVALSVVAAVAGTLVVITLRDTAVPEQPARPQLTLSTSERFSPDPDAPLTEAVRDETSTLTRYEWDWAERASERGAKTVLPEIEAAFDMDPRVQSRCHELLHEIGRRSFAYYGSVREALEAGTLWCGGYPHGVVEQWGRSVTAGELVAGLGTLCGPAPEPYCIHGAGHAIMQQATTLRNAFELCVPLPYAWNCMLGVQMVHRDTYLTPAPDAERRPDLGYEFGFYCRAVPSSYAEHCYASAAASWFETTGRTDPEAALVLCAALDAGADAAATCAEGLGVMLAGLSVGDVAAAASVCRPGPPELGDACLSGVFSQLLAAEVDPQEFCAAVPEIYRGLCRQAPSAPRFGPSDPNHSH